MPKSKHRRNGKVRPRDSLDRRAAKKAKLDALLLTLDADATMERIHALQQAIEDWEVWEELEDSRRKLQAAQDALWEATGGLI